MVLLILVGLLAWCLVPLPLAMVVGRALRAADRGDVRPRRRDLGLAA